MRPDRTRAGRLSPSRDPHHRSARGGRQRRYCRTHARGSGLEEPRPAGPRREPARRVEPGRHAVRREIGTGRLLRAGKFFWDVVSFNHLDIDALAQEGLLAAYASPETRSGFPGGAVDPEGRWAAIYVRQYVIGYNTRSVPRLQAPKSWEDLLQPVWKEKFAMDESDVEWYAAMLDYLGREKGGAFMRSLAKQNTQFRRGHSLLAKLLVAGDFPLALVHAAEMDEARRAGVPVDWVRTLDPVITSPSQVAVSAKAPHPNAARLFVDLLLSAEGQILIRDRGRVPARNDLARGPARVPLKLHYVSPRLAREADRHEKEFREIFLRGR